MVSRMLCLELRGARGVQNAEGRTAMTRRRVVALVQSLLSSRQRMIYSGRAILALTIASTCCDACTRPPFSLRLPPGAAEIKPADTAKVGPHVLTTLHS